MQNSNQMVTVSNTAFESPQENGILYVSVTIGNSTTPQQYALQPADKYVYTIGSAEDNAIRIDNRWVSSHHGALCFFHDRWHYADLGSTNGTRINNYSAQRPDADNNPAWHRADPPCALHIDHASKPLEDRVEIVLSYTQGLQKEILRLEKGKDYTIGRSASCSICIPHVTVSRRHATIAHRNGAFYISDVSSTNGVTVNSKPISGSVQLKPHDVIRIGRVMLVFMGDHVEIVRANASGVSIVAKNVEKFVQERNGFQTSRKTLLHNVSLDIKPGELVAIIGGSGAGKTTLMNALSRFTSKQGGSILIDGQDLDRDYASIKDMIGYVPQQDIVYEQLPLDKMLEYAARMRMPADTTPAERNKRIGEVLEIVQLTEHRQSLISKLSGGQKKRASIAVELLADPALFFLDEPTSGLDAGTEEKLMQSLHKLSRSGKTVILVTHSTLNLHMCDRVIAMGRGGRLCFSGHVSEAMRFFGVERISEIYHMLDNESAAWEARFGASGKKEGGNPPPTKKKGKNGISGWTQFRILCSRYTRIMTKNSKQLLGIAGQAIIFAMVLTLVSKENLYVEFQGTQIVNFVYACLGMWMGMFLAIQEITKERGIVRREYLANLKLFPYIMSKVTVLGVLSICQTVILQLGSYLFALIFDKNLPDTSLLMPCYLENGITIFMVSFASVCMGLMISALVKQPERIAPYVLMPQIVLAGVLFELEGSFGFVKKLVFTYWGNRALCVSADVNNLNNAVPGVPLKIVEDYTSSVETLLTCWGMLLLLAAVMITIACIALRSLRKDERG